MKFPRTATASISNEDPIIFQETRRWHIPVFQRRQGTAHKLSSSGNVQSLGREWIRTAIRLPRFQLFRYPTGSKQSHEPKKVALYKDRRVAWLYATIHGIPFAAAMTLIILNLRSTYIGDAQSNRIIALQFVAKLLEVLTQASIAATTLGVIRQYVLQVNDLPFGGLMAPYRTTDLSYLWSLDFWGCVTSPTLSLKRRMLLCLLLPIVILLASLVGPSSAVLMIPRPMSRPTNVELWLLDPIDQVYPTVVQLTSNGTLPEEAAFNETSAQVVINFPEDWPMPMIDEGGPRAVKWSHGETDDGPNSQFTSYLATAPTLLSAEASTYFIPLGSNSELAMQPYVYIECWWSGEAVEMNSTDSFIDFGPRKAYLNNYLPLSTLLPGFDTSSDGQSLETYQFDLMSYDRANLTEKSDDPMSAVWSVSPPGIQNHSLLIVQAFPPPINNETEPNESIAEMLIAPCTMNAYWASVSSDISNNVLAQSDLPTDKNDSPAVVLGRLQDKISIDLDPRWAKEVMVSIAERTTAQSGGMDFLSLGIPYALALSYEPDWRTYIDTFHNSTVWSRPVTGGTDLYTAYTNISDEQHNTLITYINSLNLPYGSFVYVLTNDTTWTDPSTLAQIQLTQYESGYGYNASPTTVKLALVVLLIYLVMTAAHLLYSISTGYAATSWNSIAELTALALNSEPPKVLKNTSVGIDTLETYRRPINIRVNERDSLEIVFRGSDQSEKGYTEVVVNEKY